MSSSSTSSSSSSSQASRHPSSAKYGDLRLLTQLSSSPTNSNSSTPFP
ncbi:unnamed protein product, partial [Rotaria magnacalcarata]